MSSGSQTRCVDEVRHLLRPDLKSDATLIPYGSALRRISTTVFVIIKSGDHRHALNTPKALYTPFSARISTLKEERQLWLRYQHLE
jgi:hypothetical protein